MSCGYTIISKLDLVGENADHSHEIKWYIENIRDQLNCAGLKEYPIDRINKSKFIIAIGGDGTMITAIEKTIRNCQILQPIVIGVNMGTVGFLTPFSPESKYNTALSIVDIIKSHSYNEDSIERTALVAKSKEFNIEHDIAINEFAIKSKNGGLGKFNLHIQADSSDEKRFIGQYACSGIIVSTPSGSTGLSLSAGGAIIDSSLSCAHISFMNPRSMSVRPIIVASTNSLHVECMQESVLHTDGVFKEDVLPANESFLIDLDGAFYNVLHPQFDLFESLEQKLNWNS